MRETSGEITMRVFQSNGVTIAEVEMVGLTKGGKKTLKGSGTARRDPDDKADDRVGSGLAMARALENLAQRLRKRHPVTREAL